MVELDERERREIAPLADPAAPAVFDKLRELTRNGYVPDPGGEDGSGGILLRHDSAPALILKPDGTLDLPSGQAIKHAPVAAPSAKEKRIYWRRTLVVVILTVAVWFLSLALAASFIEVIAD
jgi:hypothetical protein